jgi:cytochrome c peroxidase
MKGIDLGGYPGRRHRARRIVRAAAVVTALATSPVAAAADEPPPWAERAIREHIDFATLQGTLSPDQLHALIAAGEHLFTARFTAADGLGRPLATQAIIPTLRKRPVDIAFRRTAGMDANACSSCHNEPAPGGAGSFTANVFVSEGFESADFESLDPQFSNERNTNHLFGSGLVELLAREMTADLRAQRQRALIEARASGQPSTVALTSKGVEFGTLTVSPDGVVNNSAIAGVDADLTVRPFSQKGVFASLRQFTINAMNSHHGMEAVERFGARWTGTADFDGDGHGDELSPGDVSAVVAFQASLPPPTRLTPEDPAWREAATRGERLFDDLGCSACHRPNLPLKSLAFADPAPFDTAGTLRAGEVAAPAVYDLSLLEWAKALPRNEQGEYLVPLFGDLKRHKITDAEVNQFGNELLAQRFVERDIFQTAELWGVATTGPYGHRGDMSTLDEVVRAHGGDGRAARDAYVAAADADRSALIAFLQTLVILP